jgi:hypothetical protein
MIFAGAVSAQHLKTGVSYTTVCVRVAESDPIKARTEAEGLFLAYAKNEKFLASEGWHTHQVLSHAIPLAFIQAEAESIKAPPPQKVGKILSLVRDE